MTTIRRIANRDARRYVRQLIPFRGSNLYAEWRYYPTDQWYVVYSYGRHWPLFVYAHGEWFENADKYSMTTSRHLAQTHPQCQTTLLSSDEIRLLADVGYKAYVTRKLTGEVI